MFAKYLKFSFIVSILTFAMITSCSSGKSEQNDAGITEKTSQEYKGGTIGKLVTDQPQNTVTFEAVQPNKSQKKSFLLYNEGNGNLTIEGIKIINDEKKAFTLVNPPSLPLTLNPGKDKGIKLTVEFLPPAVDTFSARIEVNSPDADNVDTAGNFYIRLVSSK